MENNKSAPVSANTDVTARPWTVRADAADPNTPLLNPPHQRTPSSTRSTVPLPSDGVVRRGIAGKCATKKKKTIRTRDTLERSDKCCRRTGRSRPADSRKRAWTPVGRVVCVRRRAAAAAAAGKPVASDLFRWRKEKKKRKHVIWVNDLETVCVCTVGVRR